MFCYCGNCPKETPRREQFVCLCFPCADVSPTAWADINLVYTKCDKCGRTTYCHAEEKKEGTEWHL